MRGIYAFEDKGSRSVDVHPESAKIPNHCIDSIALLRAQFLRPADARLTLGAGSEHGDQG